MSDGRRASGWWLGDDPLMFTLDNERLTLSNDGAYATDRHGNEYLRRYDDRRGTCWKTTTLDEETREKK